MRDLDQNAGAVAGDRIGADRAAVLEVLQDAERVFDELVGLAAFEIGNKADATGIVFAAGIEQAARLGKKGLAPTSGLPPLCVLSVVIGVTPSS